MPLSADLRQLHTRFEDWISGRTVFETGDALAFGRDIKLCVAKACMLELGVDTSVIDADAAVVVAHDAKVVPFPAARVRRHVVRDEPVSS